MTPPAQTPAPAAPQAPPRRPGDPKPYAEVVTKEAKTQEGLFKVHRIDEKVLWEIPEELLGKDLLWQTELAEGPPGNFNLYPGSSAGTRIVRFKRRLNRLYMVDVNLSMRAAELSGAIATGVAMNTREAVIADFAVEAEGELNKAKTAVIDVSSYFLSDPSDFSVRSLVGGAGVLTSRSYIDAVNAFPRNIETRSVLTMPRAANNNPFGFIFGGPPAASTVTVKVHYSLIRLPDNPIVPRLKDSRIGYFTQDFREYGRPDGKSKEVRYINRFRLVKKDPSAALSEPVEPITFYLAREVPEKWRPYLKKGVEMWNEAFEAAGFKNAIRCLDAPTEKEDPQWSPEDARYSVIRWVPSPVANAMGPSIQDPRTGETISAHIIFWNDITTILEEWYFAQAGAIDARAQRLPFSEQLMGELIQYVSAHEVGHTLGLEHNFKASAAYTIPQLRDPKFTAQYGNNASIMSYSRFNYVAQPGDGVTNTGGVIAAYDKFAIDYGYRPTVGRKPSDETALLDQLLGKQANQPWLRFGNYEYAQDPTTLTERIGNDPVEAARLGSLNLDRIATRILFPATTKFGEDYSDLRNKSEALLSQRFTNLSTVIAYVGGVVETNFHAGRGGEVFKPVDRELQRRSVEYVTKDGLMRPAGVFDARIRNRIFPDGIVSSVTGVASTVLGSLLSEGRVRRMYDNEAANGARAYTVSEMVTTAQNNVWADLRTDSPRSDIYSRTVQRGYLTQVDRRLNGTGATRTDLALVLRTNLRRLARELDMAAKATTDPMTREHALDSRRIIELVLTDRLTKPGAAPAASSPFIFFGASIDDARRVLAHHGHRGCGLAAGSTRMSVGLARMIQEAHPELFTPAASTSARQDHHHDHDHDH